MWRGAISFGLVAIPVRLYLATESKSVSFRLLCPTCHEPIRNRRWCPSENREIGWNEAVRGYEVGKDEYVVIDDQDPVAELRVLGGVNRAEAKRSSPLLDSSLKASNSSGS